MLKTTRKHSPKKLIIALTVFFLAAIVGFSVFAQFSETDPNSNLMLGDSSFLLGESSDVSVTITEKGSLATDNLVLELQMSGEEVAQVKMRQETSILQERQTRTLGEILEEEQENLTGEALDESPYSTKLGESNFAAFSLGESSADLEDTQVEFPIQEGGVYYFDLYDAQGTLIGTKEYQVRTNTNLFLMTAADSNPLNYRSGPLKFNLTYTPHVTGDAEKVYIILPPFFSLNTYPSSGSGYTISQSTVPLPAEFYNDADSQIMKDNYAYYTKCQMLTLTFDETATETISFQFIINTPSATQLVDLTRLMLGYGDNPDVIPLRLIAKSVVVDSTTNQETFLENDIISTTSAIPDANGTPAATVSTPSVAKTTLTSGNWWNGFSSSGGVVQAMNSPGVGNVTKPAYSYPIRETYLYYLKDVTSISDMVESSYAGAKAGEEVINGKTYYKYKIDVENAGQSVATNYVMYGGYWNMQLKINFDNYDPAVVRSVPPMYVSYKYADQEVTQAIISESGDISQATYTMSESSAGNYSINPVPNSPIEGEADSQRRLQGSTGVIQVYYNNTNSGLSPYRENLTFTTTFPFEISPTKVDLVYYNSVLDTTANPITSSTLPPQSITYYVYGDTTPRTASIVDNGDGTYSANFNSLASGETVEKVEMTVDSLQSNGYQWLARYSVEYGEYDETGVLLPESKTVNLAVDVAGDSVTYPNTTNEASEPYTQAWSKDFTLIKYDKKDSLIFGLYYNSVGNEPTNYQVLNMYGSGAATVGSTFGNSGFIFKPTSKYCIDYDNVSVEVRPKSADGPKVISILDGFSVQPYYTKLQASSKFDVYITTKNNPTPTLVSYSPGATYIAFNVADGDYLTSFKIDFGTLYSDKLAYTTNSAGSGDFYGNRTGMIVAPNQTVADGVSRLTPVGPAVTLQYKRTQLFFEGTSDEMTIPNGTTYSGAIEIAATVPGAQYINNNSGARVNPVPLQYQFYTSANSSYYITNPSIGQYQTKTSTGWTQSTTPYQGTLGRIKFDANSISVQNNSAQITDKFTHATVKVYFRISNYFRVSGVDIAQTIAGPTFGQKAVQTQRTDMGDGYTLYEYTFDINTYNTYALSQTNWLSGYINGILAPDIPTTNTTNIIDGFGYELINLRKENLGYIEGKPYYTQPYYYTYYPSGLSDFPTSWGTDLYGSATNPSGGNPDAYMPSDMNDILPKYLNTTVPVNPVFNIADKAEYQMYVDQYYSMDGVFYSTDVDKLGAHVIMYNPSAAAITEYMAKIVLPREGGTTQTSNDLGGNPVYLDNDFSVYLTGPITPISSFSSLSIKYYSDEGLTDEIDPDVVGWDKVRAATLYCTDFNAKESLEVKMPLMTDYVKTDTGVEDLYSYMGITTKANDMSLPFNPQPAGEWIYRSYQIKTNVGLDVNEEGKLSQAWDAQANVEYKVYYKDAAGVEHEYPDSAYVYNGSTITTSVNDSVSRITIRPKDPTKYRLTAQNYPGVAAGANSDFSRPSQADQLTGWGEVTVYVQDIYDGKTGLYDAGFVYIPTVALADVSVVVGENKDYTPKIVLVANSGAVPAKLVNYTEEVLYSATQDKATVSTLMDSTTAYQTKMSVTGEKVGTVPYTYKITTPLGDVYEFGPKDIIVSPNYVPAVTMKKVFDTNYKALDDEDEFKVKISQKDGDGVTTDKTYTLSADGTVVNVNKTSDVSFVNFIERKSTISLDETMPAGYEGKEIILTITKADATIEEVVLDEDNPSYDVGLDVVSMAIEVVNINASANMEVSKLIPANNVLDTAAEFPIKIVDEYNTVVYNGTLKTGEKSTPVAFVYGREYTVVETLSGTNYELSNVQILKDDGTGTQVESGAQPGSAGVSVSATGALEYKYIFAYELGQEDAELRLTNAYPEGAGIQLTKAATLNGLSETFEFVLTNDNGLVSYYGKVTDTGVVEWYLDAVYTPAKKLDSLDVIPVGNYTLVEKSGTNFDFVKYTASGGASVDVTTGQSASKMTFSITKASPMVVATATNEPKENGTLKIQANFDLQYKEFVDSTHPFEYLITNTTGDSYTAQGYYNTNPAVYGTQSIVITEIYASTDTAKTTNLYNKLPYGKYTIEAVEQDYYAFVDFDSTTALTTITNPTKVGFTIDNDGASVLIEANYAIKTRSIDVSKQMLTDLGDETTKTFVFNLYRWDEATGKAVEVKKDGSVGSEDISFTITTANVSTGQTVNLPNLPYGKYVFVEQYDTSDTFVLNESFSDGVVREKTNAQDTQSIIDKLVIGKFELVDADAVGEYVGYNQLKSSTSLVMVKKDAQEIGFVPDNTFQYEFRKVINGTEKVLFEGTVASSSGVLSNSGVVTWQIAGGVTAADLGTAQLSSASGLAIATLPYGNYVIVETGTGTDYQFAEVKGNLYNNVEFGTADPANKAYRFEINATTDEYTDGLLATFTNKLKTDGKLNLSKALEGTNYFPGSTFVFTLKDTLRNKTYTGEVTDTGTVTSWKLADGTTISNTQLPYGTYELVENTVANFALKDFSQGAGTTAAVSFLNSNTKVSFQVNATQNVANIVATNKIKEVGTLNIGKYFQGNNSFSNGVSINVYGPGVKGTQPTNLYGTYTIDASTSWSKVLSTLPLGSYVVEEVITDPNSPYEVVGINTDTKSVLSTDTVSARLEILLSEEAGESAVSNVAVTNKIAKKGKLDITKYVEGYNTMPDTLFSYRVTDADGAIHDFTIKAGETKSLTGLPLGTIKIVETMDDNLNYLGMAVDGATRVVNSEVTTTLTMPNVVVKVDSYSEYKKDGSYTISTTLDPEFAKVAAGELYDFKLYQSVDGGANWIVVPASASKDGVTLAPEASYTYTSLLRGALYKAVSERKPTSAYMVKEVQAGTGTVFTDINLVEGSATFQPTSIGLNGTAIFVMDYKRTDLTIDKFYNDTGAKVEGVGFIVQRNTSEGWKIVGFRKTDQQGNIVFPGLLAGEYRITEKTGPRNVVVLQSDAWFTIENNNQTGLLEVKMSEKSDVISVEGNILHIANGFKNRSGEGSSQQDGNPGGFGVAGEDAAGSQNMGTTNEKATGGILSTLPDTGGMPLWYLAILGAGLAVLGSIICLLEKKNRKH